MSGLSGNRFTAGSLSARSTTLPTKSAATVAPATAETCTPYCLSISARDMTMMWNATRKKTVGGKSSSSSCFSRSKSVMVFDSSLAQATLGPTSSRRPLPKRPPDQQEPDGGDPASRHANADAGPRGPQGDDRRRREGHEHEDGGRDSEERGRAEPRPGHGGPVQVAVQPAQERGEHRRDGDRDAGVHRDERAEHHDRAAPQEGARMSAAGKRGSAGQKPRRRQHEEHAAPVRGPAKPGEESQRKD